MPRAKPCWTGCFLIFRNRYDWWRDHDRATIGQQSAHTATHRLVNNRRTQPPIDYEQSEHSGIRIGPDILKHRCAFYATCWHSAEKSEKNGGERVFEKKGPKTLCHGPFVRGCTLLRACY